MKMTLLPPVQCELGTNGCHYNGITRMQHEVHCLSHRGSPFATNLHYCDNTSKKLSAFDITFDRSKKLGITVQANISGDLEIVSMSEHAQVVFKNLRKYTRVLSIGKTLMRSAKHISFVIKGMQVEVKQRKKTEFIEQVQKLDHANKRLQANKKKANAIDRPRSKLIPAPPTSTVCWSKCNLSGDEKKTANRAFAAANGQIIKSHLNRKVYIADGKIFNTSRDLHQHLFPERWCAHPHTSAVRGPAAKATTAAKATLPTNAEMCAASVMLGLSHRAPSETPKRKREEGSNDDYTCHQRNKKLTLPK